MCVFFYASAIWLEFSSAILWYYVHSICVFHRIITCRNGFIPFGMNPVFTELLITIVVATRNFGLTNLKVILDLGTNISKTRSTLFGPTNFMESFVSITKSLHDIDIFSHSLTASKFPMFLFFDARANRKHFFSPSVAGTGRGVISPSLHCCIQCDG